MTTTPSTRTNLTAAPITPDADRAYTHAAADPETATVWALHVPTTGVLSDDDVAAALRTLAASDRDNLVARHLTGEYVTGYSFAEWGETKETAAPTTVGHLALYFRSRPHNASTRGAAILRHLPMSILPPVFDHAVTTAGDYAEHAPRQEFEPGTRVAFYAERLSNGEEYTAYGTITRRLNVMDAMVNPDRTSLSVRIPYSALTRVG